MATTTVRRTNMLNVLSYVAVICIGIALALSWILAQININGGSTVVNALDIIARFLSYFVVACYSYRYAKVKGMAYLIAWIVAIVLIIVFDALAIVR